MHTYMYTYMHTYTHTHTHTHTHTNTNKLKQSTHPLIKHVHFSPTCRLIPHTTGNFKKRTEINTVRLCTKHSWSKSNHFLSLHMSTIADLLLFIGTSIYHLLQVTRHHKCDTVYIKMQNVRKHTCLSGVHPC